MQYITAAAAVFLGKTLRDANSQQYGRHVQSVQSFVQSPREQKA